MVDNSQKQIQFALDSRSKRRRKLRQRFRSNDRPHTVQQQWKEHWRGMRTGGQMKREVKRAPYGKHVGYEKEWNEDKQRFYPIGRAKQMPIYGPPNWDQLWNEWPDIGTDHSQQPANPNLSPLSPRQLESLDRYSYIFGNIQFIRALSAGTYGAVWLVQCHRREVYGTWDLLACKVIKAITGGINPAHMTMLNGMRLLVQDINACMGLDHRNIVRYLDVITIPDETTHFPYSTILILMPLCHGDVFNMLECINLLTVNIAYDLLEQMTRAIRYIHKLNIVHLDIKPENILVQFENWATQLTEQTIMDYWDKITYKLTDFGCARMHLYKQPQMTTLKAGSLEYAAPEMLQVEQYLPLGVRTKPCDIYSFGATIISSMSDPEPYGHYQGQGHLDDFMVEISNNDEFRMQYAEPITPFFADILLNMVHFDPVQRYTIQDIWTNLDIQPLTDDELSDED